MCAKVWLIKLARKAPFPHFTFTWYFTWRVTRTTENLTNEPTSKQNLPSPPPPPPKQKPLINVPHADITGGSLFPYSMAASWASVSEAVRELWTIISPTLMCIQISLESLQKSRFWSSGGGAQDSASLSGSRQARAVAWRPTSEKRGHSLREASAHNTCQPRVSPRPSAWAALRAESILFSSSKRKYEGSGLERRTDNFHETKGASTQKDYPQETSSLQVLTGFSQAI